MKFTYKEADYGKYIVTDGKDIRVNVFTEISAMTLVDLLNKVCKKIEYQDRVIEKCIKDDAKYKSLISDKNELIKDLDFQISVLLKEKRVLKKIIHDLDDELKYYDDGVGL